MKKYLFLKTIFSETNFTGFFIIIFCNVCCVWVMEVEKWWFFTCYVQVWSLFVAYLFPPACLYKRHIFHIFDVISYLNVYRTHKYRIWKNPCFGSYRRENYIGVNNNYRLGLRLYKHIVKYIYELYKRSDEWKKEFDEINLFYV